MSPHRGAKGPGYREPPKQHFWAGQKTPWAARKKPGSQGRREL
jgi:hypothetical protein